MGSYPPNNFRNKKHLEDELQKLIQQGAKIFIAGDALGFDTLAAQAVLKLRERYPAIRLHLALPCPTQTSGWPAADMEKYGRIKALADKCEFISDHYYNGCMQKRNRYMVDQSAYCICYLTQPKGGTKYTVDYAAKRGLQIINIAESSGQSNPKEVEVKK